MCRPDRPEPPLCRPGAWAGLWRRIGASGDLNRCRGPRAAA